MKLIGQSLTGERMNSWVTGWVEFNETEKKWMERNNLAVKRVVFQEYKGGPTVFFVTTEGGIDCKPFSCQPENFFKSLEMFYRPLYTREIQAVLPVEGDSGGIDEEW